MKRLERKHPLAVRWLHWINFPLLFLMIWSGILIYWANAVYGIRVFGYELFHFFPAWFNEALSIPFQLANGMALHFFFMWFFLINGILYVAYTIPLMRMKPSLTQKRNASPKGMRRFAVLVSLLNGLLPAFVSRA